MIPARRGIGQRPFVLLWGLIDVVVITAVAAQMIRASWPRQRDVPASVIEWGNRSRESLLKVGDLAPPFRLIDSRSKQEIELAGFRDRKPVVLIFGSYTCPMFRSQVPALNDLYSKYKDRMAFFMVYIREAHPEEDGHIPENDSIGRIPAPKDSRERTRLAQTLATELKVAMPVLVDNMENGTASGYTAWPHRVFVVDETGKIVYAGADAGGLEGSAFTGTLDALNRGVRDRAEGRSECLGVL